MTKEIPLSRGLVALVSDEDYERVSAFKWYAAAPAPDNRAYYAGRVLDRYGKILFLHRFIVGAKDGEVVDHINRNPLDNRRENLRICDKSTDLQNRSKKAGASSKYVGVALHKSTGRYQACISKNGVHYSLGSYASEEEAARAYDDAALKHYGEYARLNFPATTRPPSA